MTQWGLDVLFNPAKRHMDEEKQRLQSTREEVGDNSGGKRIDLESGKVTIPKQDDTGDAEGGTDSVARNKKDAPKKELTPAQERALKRRGRSAG